MIPSQYFVKCLDRRYDFAPTREHHDGKLSWSEWVAGVDGQSLHLSIRPLGHQAFRCMLYHAGSKALDLHFGVEWPVAFTDDSYTLIPGIFYNGNNSEPVKDPVVRWGREELEPLGFAMHASAAPLIMHRSADGTTLLAEGEPVTLAGWSGWQVDRSAGTLSYCVPAIERKRMRHWQWEDHARPAYRLLPRGTLGFSFRAEFISTASTVDLVQRYADRMWPGETGDVNHAMLAETAGKVFAHMKASHWAEDENGRPVCRNAVFPAEDMLGLPLPPWATRWNVASGWNAGPGVALPMLKSHAADRARAIAFLDMMAAEAVGPGGLVYPLYDEETATWRKDDPSKPNEYFSVRMPGEFADFLYRAWHMEQASGISHPSWRDAARTVTDSLCGLWEREGDFGHLVDYTSRPPRILSRGSCAGAFAVRALATRMAVEGIDERTRAVYLAASEHYYHRYIARGHATGGPLDIDQADDSESAAALAAAWTLGPELLGSEALLRYARAAADLFSTWVFSWSAPFPPGSTLDGRDPRGGVLANVQNRHLGPGICTDGGGWLKDLSRLTGDGRYATMHRHIIHAACRFVSRSDGDLWGGNPGGYETFVPFRKGQVTEQINMSDFFHDPGEIWHVSAAWPSMAILLAAIEEGDFPGRRRE